MRTPTQELDDIRENPSYETMLTGIKAVLEATVSEGRFSCRIAKRLTALVRKAAKKASDEPDRIRLSEVARQIQTGALPATVLETFSMNSDRVANAKVLENVAAIPTSDRENWPHDKPIVAGNTGLLEQARKIAEERHESVGTDHLLAAMDQRFPYATPAKASRDLSELRDELAVYMEYDEIMVEWHPEETDPFRRAAEHRTKMMEQVPLGPEPLWYRQLQQRAKTDLMFLARSVLGLRFVNKTHREMCEFFVQLDPSLPLDKQSPQIKDRLLLFPRGAFKSTCNICSCLQFLMAFPDVRILILTATRKLSRLFLQQLKGFFISVSGDPETTWQQLFPQYVIKSNEDGQADTFDLKNHVSQQKEPNVMCSSLESRLPGIHCDLQILDDCVDDINSATEDQIDKVVNAIDLAESLLDPGGTRIIIGTPYDREDYYAQMQKRAPNVDSLKVLYKPARTVKSEKSSVPAEQLKPEDYDYLFVERLSPKFLLDKEHKNRRTFASQYLLKFLHDSDVTFPIDLLLRAVVPFSALPTKAINYMSWDFAYSTRSLSDYTVGVVGAVDDKNQTYIIDMYRDHYQPRDLAQTIVDAWIRYKPQLISIEGSNGAQNLRPAIENIALSMGITDCIPLNFVTVDVKKNAKHSRIAVLEPMLRQGFLHFSDQLPDLDELIAEFEAYPSGRNDDVLDAVAYLFSTQMSPSRYPAQDPGETRRLQEDYKARELEYMLYPDEPLPQEKQIGPGEGTGEDAPDPPWNPYEQGPGFGPPTGACRR
jgi:predicted phage terminase large subunit-like protein